jgi:hypothetical protein
MVVPDVSEALLSFETSGNNCSHTAQSLRRRESSGMRLSSLILVIIKIVVNFFIGVFIVKDNPSLEVKTAVGKRLVAVVAVCLELVCSL